ncbi:MAG: hypothetical protein M0P09_06765, partial [Acholeplasmataceae bacterium]|nr:hypothetical protein [Acholeplasmataceae bacterium]
LDLLAKKPFLTPPEIAAELYVVERTVKIYLDHLEKEGLVYIAKWTREEVIGQRSFPRAQWALGEHKSRPKPPPRSKSAIAKDFRRRVLNDPIKYEASYEKMMRTRARLLAKYRSKRLKDLAKAGYTDSNMARLLGERIMIGEKRRTPSADQILEVLRLREKGATWDSISEQVGIPKTTARDHYNRSIK